MHDQLDRGPGGDGGADLALPAGAVETAEVADYRAAWAAWSEQLRQVHAWRLGGERLDPPRIKALLLREARAYARYAAARRALLGLPEDDA